MNLKAIQERLFKAYPIAPNPSLSEIKEWRRLTLENPEKMEGIEKAALVAALECFTQIRTGEDKSAMLNQEILDLLKVIESLTKDNDG